MDLEAIYDTGAQVSVLGDEVCRNIGKSYVSNRVSYRLANNQIDEFCGFITVITKIGTKELEHKFYVSTGSKIILGLDAINKFELQQQGKYKISQILPNSRSESFSDLEICNCDINPNPRTTNQTSSLEILLNKYDSLFATFKGEVGRIRLEECFINTTTQRPIHLKPYRTTAQDQEKIDKLILEYCERKMIRKSRSPWGFPVVLVDKKDDGEKSRLCVDYRALNKITIDESFPMPMIDDIEDRLIGASVFTTLDVSSGFHHVVITKNDVQKTAFVTMNGKYEWMVMPFGLKNAPLIFQRVIHNLLWDYELTRFTHNYIDDIIIFSNSISDHLEHLERVFEMLDKENIILKRSKCDFLKQKISYLGYQISFNKVEPIHSKTQAINDLPAPHDVKSVRSFVGKVNYYKKFIPNRTEVLAPLYELTKKNVRFNWTEKEQKSFDLIKSILMSHPALGIFDPNRHILIKTDASEIGIGAVMKQKNDDADLVTIAYFSKKLLPYQQKYIVTERECLAIVEAIEYWSYYLMGRKFTVETDHKPLEWLMKTSHTKTRLFNWALKLSQFNFDIVYIPGEDNVEADHLSRNPPVELSHFTLDEIVEIQRPFIDYLPKGCTMYNGMIVKNRKDRDRLYIPNESAIPLLWKIHNSYGHLGHCQMSEHFSIKYFTENLNQLIDEVIKSCEVCLRAKQGSKYGTLGRIGPALGPFEIIFIDTVGGLTGRSPKRYLHLAIDSFSRFVWGCCSRTQRASDFIRLIKKIKEDGCPGLVVADRFSAINSKEFKQYLRGENIEILFTPVDHPQSNGMVERVNQTLIKKITLYDV